MRFPAVQALGQRFQVGKGDIYRLLLNVADVAFGQPAELPEPFLSIATRVAQPAQVGRESPQDLRRRLSVVHVGPVALLRGNLHTISPSSLLCVRIALRTTSLTLREMSRAH